MPTFPSTWPRVPWPTPGDGPSRRVRWVVAGACLLAALAVRLAFPAGLPEAAALVREGVVLAGFAALWFAAQSFFERRPASPLRTLGTPIAAALMLLLAAALTRVFGMAASEAPAAVEVLRQQVIALLQMGFVFFLLFQLRRLVLYRRTRSGQRNWRLMLLLMSIAALTAFGRAPGHDLGALQIVPIVGAVVLMVLNSFRLSWVIGLSVREKVAGAAFSLGLLIVVSVVTIGESSLAPGADANALETYSYVLDVFALQVGVFGILYSLTALLSLVFHLPTTGDVQRKSDETAALHALAHLVDQAFDPAKLAESIAAAPVEAGSADAAWLVLQGSASERLGQAPASREQTGEEPHVAAACRLVPGDVEQRVDLGALFDEVRRTQAPLVLPHARSDARVRPAGDAAGEELASLLVVPLMARRAFVGALFAARNVSRGFEKDDVSSIQAFASQAALALDHARLFEEQIEMERLERELDIARTVQQRLLPRRLPAVDGLALAAGSTPAREVGGDYYDFATLAGGRLAFIVADVSGKGTSAAFYMAEMQGLFRSLSRLKPAPTEFLCHANDALRDILEEGVFVSALYGLLDPERRTLTLARAGHCPAAFMRAGEAPRLLRPDGLGLGLAPTPLFKSALAEERLRLRPGDTLALYTDGLVETRSSTGGEEYGYDRLLRSLRARSQERPGVLRSGLLEDLRAFTTRDAYDDDLTLMVLQWHGPPAEAAEQPPASAQKPAAASLAAASGSTPHTAGPT